MDTKEFEREALRAMTPEAKLAILRSMIRQAYEHLRQSIGQSIVSLRASQVVPTCSR